VAGKWRTIGQLKEARRAIARRAIGGPSGIVNKEGIGILSSVKGVLTGRRIWMTFCQRAEVNTESQGLPGGREGKGNPAIQIYKDEPRAKGNESLGICHGC